MKNTKTTAHTWDLEQSPVWVEQVGIIKPTPFFLKWWQNVSIFKYGDELHWLDVAVDLGYVLKTIDPISKGIIYLPEGFDYDPQLFRKSLGIPLSMPIITQGNNEEDYQRLLNWLRCG